MIQVAVLCATLAFHDGDSGRACGQRFRLQGVDAGETSNTRCRTRPQVWACSPVARRYGPIARARVRQLVANGARCIDTGERSYDRLVVRCTVNGRDLGAILVREGLAISERGFGDRYRAEENIAQRDRVGVWQ
ncbi:thermonuclease family protein [Brevundimonas sp. NIBR11]|uniref:thermonuclease family protein n=1 Tax=Brevundimonas sp. NIBR11 TaxID=3015999 RepID=UPI0022EFF337|nr:thermonuclease family protein [Brevundimonas sp. NIBR11]WGM31450.1 hypothetical protein KKHFBJBL_01697 [Brevundimonas sp. NIBR11]